MHSLTLEQRRQFLVVWLPIDRFALMALTTEMQFVALRHFYHRYRAAPRVSRSKPGGARRAAAHESAVAKPDAQNTPKETSHD
jgi:hypothetical protein